jgi:hypothetical protein
MYFTWENILDKKTKTIKEAFPHSTRKHKR